MERCHLIAVITRHQVRESLSNGARALVDEVGRRMRRAHGLPAAYRLETLSPEVLSITIWDSRADADAALADADPAVQAALGDNLGDPPHHTYAEVASAFARV